MIYLANSFSVAMVNESGIEPPWVVTIRPITSGVAGEYLCMSYRSYYGHAETAKHLGRYLRIDDVPVNRGLMKLKPGDIIIVASVQRTSDYIARGCHGAPKWKFYKISVKGNHDPAEDRSAAKDIYAESEAENE